jgi:hypothetical protein
MAYFTRQAARNGAKPERIEPVTPRARVTKKKQQPQMRKSHPAGKQIPTPKQKKQLEAKVGFLHPSSEMQAN